MMTNDPYKQFERWAKLAKESPEQFEAERLQLIGDFIDQAPEKYKQRLKQLQWQVEGVKRRSNSSAEVMQRLREMMLVMVQRQQHLFQQMAAISRGEDVNFSEEELPLLGQAPKKKSSVLEISSRLVD